jgi:uncharacterized membrane protein YccC
MLVWGVAANMLVVLPSAFSHVALSATVLFSVSLPYPTTVPQALERGLMIAVGALWGMAISLGTGPLHYYRPARRAVAQTYRSLADRLESLSRSLRTTPTSGEWVAALTAQHPPIRAALHSARETLAATRLGRESESERGERLVVLTESADQIFATISALSDVLEPNGVGDLSPESSAEIADELERLSHRLRRVAQLTATDRLRHPEVAPLEPGSRTGAFAVRATKTQATSLLERALNFVRAAEESAEGLERTSTSATLAWLRPRLRGRRWSRMLVPLRANLTLESVAFRHALRVGIVAAGSVLLVRLLHLPYGHWLTLSAIIIMQPFAGATTVRGISRIVGTVLGSVIAVAISSLVRGPAELFPIIFLLAGAAVAVLPLNYAAFAMFSTPTFVLLAELNAGSWRLVPVRILDTLFGAALAVLASTMLWPSREREEVPETLAAALRALRAFAADALSMQGDAAASESLIAARRRLSLALTNADSSLERLAAERSSPRATTEALMAVVAYTRRLAASLTALALSGAHTPDSRIEGAGRGDELASHLLGTLDLLADSLESGRGGHAADRALAAEDGADEEIDGGMLSPRLRVLRQLDVLRDAVARTHGETRS